MALPTNVDTGRVEGRFIVGVVDGPDQDLDPDGIPAQGTITFTASVPYLPDPFASPAPVTILKAPITGVLDSEGYLCTPDPADPSKPGYRGLRLIATDDPDLSVTGWTWTVTYNFQRVSGTALSIASHSMALPSGATVDLTTVVKVPSSTGIGIEQAEALAAQAAQSAAEAASQVDSAVQAVVQAQAAAEDAADSASQATQATDTAVAGLITSDGATSAALDTAYRTAVNVREFGAVGDAVADDTAAIQAAIDSLSGTISQGGGTVFFDYGSYNITSPIVISKPGIHLRSSGAFTAVLRVDPAMTGAVLTYQVPGAVYRGPRISDLRIYMRGAEATGIRVVGGYDNFMMENVFIDGVGKTGTGIEIVPSPDGPPVSQTLTAVNVWVSGSRDEATRHTGYAWRLNNLQEAVFLGCKGLAGGETSGTAWRIEDCRGIQFYGCSAAFANIGFDVQAMTRAVVGITVDGPTLESVATTLRTAGSNVSGVSFRGLRSQVGQTLPAGPITLANTHQSTLETRSLVVTVASTCTNVQILTDDRTKVTDSGPSTTVIQWANANGPLTLPNVNISSATPISRYRSTTSTETWEHLYVPGTGFIVRYRDNVSVIRDALTLIPSPGAGTTAVNLLVNDGTNTTSRRIRIGAPDSGGTGRRVLTVDN